MDFWDAYGRMRQAAGFGTKPLILSTGYCYNASIARLEPRSVELGIGKALSHRYTPQKRYLVAKWITFDVFVSFYDVNSKSLLALRPSVPIGRKDISSLSRVLDGWKRPRIEVRLIGMQDNDSELSDSIAMLRKIRSSVLAEADLFGNQARHVIIDLLTGKPYSLLLENRIYRPGELINKLKKEEFDRARSELSFM